MHSRFVRHEDQVDLPANTSDCRHGLALHLNRDVVVLCQVDVPATTTGLGHLALHTITSGVRQRSLMRRWQLVTFVQKTNVSGECQAMQLRGCVVKNPT